MIHVVNEKLNLKLKIIGFVRDAQMNPALVHSKRFVISPIDYQVLAKQLVQHVYFIEFQLHNLKQLSAFSNSFALSGLPQNGPALDYHLFQILNCLSDGIVVGVIVLVSLMLILISLFCLRFTILATIEEDYREIGVLKAMGVQLKQIKTIY